MATIRTDGTVTRDGETMRIVGHQGFDDVLLKDKDGRILSVPVAELLEEAVARPKSVVPTDPIRLAKVARYKEAFGKLIGSGSRTRKQVAAAGASLEISPASAYRALERFDLTGDYNELPPPTRPGGKGGARIVQGAERIIGEEIERILLTRRQHRVAFFMKSVKKKLAAKGFAVSDATLARRVEAVPSAVWIAKREGHRTAKRLLDPHRGEAPTGDAPLDIVQVDHWKTDLEILSDDRLTGIGRAWLTLGIDVFTRVVWGWHLGLDHPGTVPTAYCMISGMTRKDATIKALGLTTRMPFWGKPKVLHLDNAGEFRGRALAFGCAHNHITLKFRPVESPQFGAHIERLNGTLAGKFKDLPGATGSSPRERKALRPEVTTALTFDDLAKQLVMIFDEYHNTPHSGIGNLTPLAKWTGHFFHDDGRPKRKLPAITVDDLEFRIAWYPQRQCTLQAYGIRVQFLDYYNEEIEQLVRNRGDYGKLDVKRNPLDVREIYLLHPLRKEWVIVTCRYLSFPVASMKELQDSRREAKRLGREPTPANLATIIDERQQHLEETVKKTKTAAREATLAANNKKMRAKAPKTFDRPVAPYDEDDHDEPVAAPVAEQARKPGPKPAKTPPRPDPFGHGDRGGEGFAGAAAALADISDDDIDRYLDDH
jgi:putative transposase